MSYSASFMCEISASQIRSKQPFLILIPFLCKLIDFIINGSPILSANLNLQVHF